MEDNVITRKTNGGGRAKLTLERTKLIIAAIEEGHIREDAAVLAGVSKVTLYAWLEEGEQALLAEDEGESLDERALALRDFWLDYSKAIASRTLAMLKRMSSTESNAVVTSCTWQLTHYRPKAFAPPQRVEVSGRDGGAIEHTATVRVIALPPLEDATDEDRSAVAGEPRPAVAVPVVGR